MKGAKDMKTLRSIGFASAICAMLAVAAPAGAQMERHHERTVRTHHRVMVRHHHRYRSCRNFWRHHHRQRVCTWRWR
jgi:hypothetical protein